MPRRETFYSGPTAYEVYKARLEGDPSLFMAEAYGDTFGMAESVLFISHLGDRWDIEGLVAAGERIHAMWGSVLAEVGADHPSLQFEKPYFRGLKYRKGGYDRRGALWMPDIKLYGPRRDLIKEMPPISGWDVESQQIVVYPTEAIARQCFDYYSRSPDWERGPIKYEPVLSGLVHGRSLSARSVARLTGST